MLNTKRVWWDEELELWKPPKILTVSECADAHRILGRGSSKPGRWETDFVPFLREIMDAFGQDCIEEIWFVKPTQTGGTETILNMVLYAALQDPGPAMIIEPTENLADEISQDRIDQMIESCDQLKEIKSPDLDDTTKKKKSFSSMTLYFAWSRSPSSLASRPIRYAFFDEVDKYEKFTGEEASPIALGKERTNTFVFTRKLVYVSTPTTDGNYITVGEKACDARFRYQVQCPHCGKMQIFIFDQIKWGELKEIKEIEDLAWYECVECAGKIHNDQKSEMVRRGKWFDLISGLECKECLDVERPKRIGFQINRLPSPWHTFGMVAGEFLRSKDYPEQLMNWKNSWMAEPWVEKYEAKSEIEMLANRVELEPFICPKATIALTVGIDPGQGGFWFTVQAWKRDINRNIESCHLVHYGFLVGWEAVRQLVWENTYQIEGSDHRMGIWRAGIDTGGSKYDAENVTMTEAAYDWLRKYGKGRAFATKGMSHASGHRVRNSNIDRMPGPKGQLIPGGIVLFSIDTDSFKDMIHYRLQVKEGDPGRFTFHKNTEKDYIDHLLAEEKRRNRKGEYEWVRIRPRNHLFDCTVIAFAMADPEAAGGVRVLRIPAEPAPELAGPPPINPVTQKPKGDWVKGW